MPGLTFLHKVSEISKSDKKGVNTAHEEEIYHGDKGTTIKFFDKNGEKSEKVVVQQKGEDEFLVRTVKDGERKEETMTKAALLKKYDAKKYDFMTKFIKIVTNTEVDVRARDQRSPRNRNNQDPRSPKSPRDQTNRSLVLLQLSLKPMRCLVGRDVRRNRRNHRRNQRKPCREANANHVNHANPPVNVVKNQARKTKQKNDI